MDILGRQQSRHLVTPALSVLLEEQLLGVHGQVEESLVAKIALEVCSVAETWGLPRLICLHCPGERLLSPPGVCVCVCLASQPYSATPPPYPLKEF